MSPSYHNSTGTTQGFDNSTIKNFLIVACVLKDLGYSAKGIRLDSGDLANLSINCRALMKEVSKTLGDEKYDFSYC